MDPMGYELGYPLVHEANLGYGITQIRWNSLWKHHPKQRWAAGSASVGKTRRFSWIYGFVFYPSYGYGSIPIDTFLVGWTSIYQLFWCELQGTRFWHTAILTTMTKSESSLKISGPTCATSSRSFRISKRCRVAGVAGPKVCTLIVVMRPTRQFGQFGLISHRIHVPCMLYIYIC